MAVLFPDAWRVEYVGDGGEMPIALFFGGDNEQRAKDYAGYINNRGRAATVLRLVKPVVEGAL